MFPWGYFSIMNTRTQVMSICFMGGSISSCKTCPHFLCTAENRLESTLWQGFWKVGVSEVCYSHLIRCRKTTTSPSHSFCIVNPQNACEKYSIFARAVEHNTSCRLGPCRSCTTKVRSTLSNSTVYAFDMGHKKAKCIGDVYSQNNHACDPGYAWCGIWSFQFWPWSVNKHSCQPPNIIKPAFPISLKGPLRYFIAP